MGGSDAVVVVMVMVAGAGAAMMVVVVVAAAAAAAAAMTPHLTRRRAAQDLRIGSRTKTKTPQKTLNPGDVEALRHGIQGTHCPRFIPCSDPKSSNGGRHFGGPKVATPPTAACSSPRSAPTTSNSSSARSWRARRLTALFTSRRRTAFRQAAWRKRSRR